MTNTEYLVTTAILWAIPVYGCFAFMYMERRQERADWPPDASGRLRTRLRTGEETWPGAIAGFIGASLAYIGIGAFPVLLVLAALGVL